MAKLKARGRGYLRCGSVVLLGLTLSACALIPPPKEGQFKLLSNESLIIQSSFDRSYALAGKSGSVARKLTPVPDFDYGFQTDLDGPTIYAGAARSDGLLRIDKKGNWRKIETEKIGDFGGYTALFGLPDGGAIVARNKLAYNLPDGSYPNKIFRLDADGEVVWSTVVGLYVSRISVDDNRVILSGDDGKDEEQPLYITLDLENGSKVEQTSAQLPESWYNFDDCAVRNDTIYCVVGYPKPGNGDIWDTSLVKFSLGEGKQLGNPVFLENEIYNFRFINDKLYGVRESSKDHTKLYTFDLDGNLLSKEALDIDLIYPVIHGMYKQGTKLYLDFWATEAKKSNLTVKKAQSVLCLNTDTGKITSETYDIPKSVYLGAGPVIPSSWFTR